ncbi:MAG: PilZ domain-containing protein [Desulfobacterales bacterium]
MEKSGREKKQTRDNTRTRVWEDTSAIVKVADPYSQSREVLTVKGRVADLGGTGMFLVTGDPVPVPAEAEISIDFDPDRPSLLRVHARGQTVRTSADGVGIRFTDIDLNRLQQCILARMNR